jgi:hypothetical protein
MFISQIKVAETTYDLKTVSTYQNISVSSSSWTSSTDYEYYPYKATINLNEITPDHIVKISFSNMDVINYKIASEVLSNNGSITIYAAKKPTSTITIPAISYSLSSIIN